MLADSLLLLIACCARIMPDVHGSITIDWDDLNDKSTSSAKAADLTVRGILNVKKDGATTLYKVSVKGTDEPRWIDENSAMLDAEMVAQFKQKRQKQRQKKQEEACAAVEQPRGSNKATCGTCLRSIMNRNPKHKGRACTECVVDHGFDCSCSCAAGTGTEGEIVVDQAVLADILRRREKGEVEGKIRRVDPKFAS
jgi:hypothetical protein